jgi:DNA mismatch endonuclease (patch repair protein)
MADIFSKEKRSIIMSSIHGRHTGPELTVRKFLYSKGLRYRLHAKDLPGKPDMVFRRFQIAVQVNGCFWHGHKGCRLAVYPKTNIDFWKTKIDANRERDTRNERALRAMGWMVIVLWECQLTSKRRKTTLKKLHHRISKRIDQST